MTDPTGAVVSYAYDKTGRMTDVTGSSFAGVTQYASNVRFRAWGALKSLAYGNSKTLFISYNNSLQATSYEVPGVLKKNYQYYNDGTVRFTQDQITTNSKYDRFYEFDHAGRVITALSGAEARGQGTTDDRPYKETLTYDPLNHLTMIDGRNWDAPSGIGPDTYVNDRNTAWTYDADGRILIGPSGYFHFDAAGRVYSFEDGVDDKTDQQFDGDGRRTKAVHFNYDDQLDQWTTESTTYFVTSSVLGGSVVTELNASGAKQQTFIYAGGSVLASQTVTGSTESVSWRHVDASGASVRATDAVGQSTVGLAELDAVGADAGLVKPITWTPPNKEGKLLPYLGFEDINSPGGGCELDRMPIPCDRLHNLMEAGGVESEVLVRETRASEGRPTLKPPKMRTPPVLAWAPRRQAITSHGLGLFTTGVPVWRADNEGGGLTSEQRLFSAHGNNSKDGEQQAIDDAVAAARTILSTDNSCSRFFGGFSPVSGLQNGAQVLDQLAGLLQPGYLGATNRSTGIRMSNFSTVVDTPTNLEYRLPGQGSAVVNRIGPFYSGGRFGSFASSSPQGRVLAVLHELAHLIRVATLVTDEGREPIWLIPDDGGDDDQSRENTRTVEAACRDQLNALQ